MASLSRNTSLPPTVVGYRYTQAIEGVGANLYGSDCISHRIHIPERKLELDDDGSAWKSKSEFLKLNNMRKEQVPVAVADEVLSLIDEREALEARLAAINQSIANATRPLFSQMRRVT